jgi:predicted esterase
MPAIDRPSFACLAPAAAGGTWYPLPFIAPREKNEPFLSSALDVLASVVDGVLARGIPAEKIVLLGFSQGACLSSEFAIRRPRRYGGLCALSGGLIGAPGTTWDGVVAAFDGMPVFLGCSDVDSHIPKQRVIESDIVFKHYGANVTRKLYPGMGHLVNDDEILEVQAVLDEVLTNR